MSQIQEEISQFKEKLVSLKSLIQKLESTDSIFQSILTNLENTSTSIQTSLTESEEIKGLIEATLNNAKLNSEQMYDLLKQTGKDIQTTISQTLIEIETTAAKLLEDFDDFSTKHDTFHGELFDELEEHFEETDKKQLLWNEQINKHYNIIDEKTVSTNKSLIQIQDLVEKQLANLDEVSKKQDNQYENLLIESKNSFDDTQKKQLEWNEKLSKQSSSIEKSTVATNNSLAQIKKLVEKQLSDLDEVSKRHDASHEQLLEKINQHFIESNKKTKLFIMINIGLSTIAVISMLSLILR